MRIDATGAQEHQSLHSSQVSAMDQGGRDHQVLVQKVGAVPAVRLDSAYLAGSNEDVLRPLLGQVVMHRTLVQQVQFVMGAEQQVVVAASLEPTHDGSAHHATVAGDEDLCFAVHWAGGLTFTSRPAWPAARQWLAALARVWPLCVTRRRLAGSVLARIRASPSQTAEQPSSTVHSGLTHTNRPPRTPVQFKCERRFFMHRASADARRSRVIWGGPLRPAVVQAWRFMPDLVWTLSLEWGRVGEPRCRRILGRKQRRQSQCGPDNADRRIIPAHAPFRLGSVVLGGLV